MKELEEKIGSISEQTQKFRDGKKASFFEEISNWVSSLWNKIVSYFCFSASSTEAPAQNHESMSRESAEKVKKVESVTKERLRSRGKRIDDLGERTEKLRESSIDFVEQARRIGVQEQESRGWWNFL